jgi:hypothetical protein
MTHRGRRNSEKAPQTVRGLRFSILIPQRRVIQSQGRLEFHMS